MRLLAIDPGTKHMGWFDGEQWGTWDFPEKLPRAERLALALRALEEKIRGEMTDSLDVDYTVVYEEQFNRGRDATKCLLGVQGIIEAVATDAGSAVLFLNNSTTKKWTGAKTKDQMIKWAARKVDHLNVVGVQFCPPECTSLNEHEADAIAIYYYALEHMEIG